MALQSVISRRIAPSEPAVLTLGSVHGGDAFNVVPDSVSLRGTVRTFSDASERRVEEEIRRVAAGVGLAHGCEIAVTWIQHTRPTVNDPAIAAQVATLAASVPGVHTVLRDYRTMAGEDFGEILARVPGCYALIGSANADEGHTEPHHSPRFTIDERALDIAYHMHLGAHALTARERP